MKDKPHKVKLVMLIRKFLLWTFFNSAFQILQAKFNTDVFEYSSATNGNKHNFRNLKWKIFEFIIDDYHYTRLIIFVSEG